jgi:hypothetical protein
MKFMVRWSIREDRWLSILKLWSEMTPQQRADGGSGVKILGRWHDLAARSGVAILEATDLAGSSSPSIYTSLGAETGSFGGLRVRSLGPRPLISDGGVYSSPPTTVNARVGYVFESGIKVNLDVFNLFNNWQASQIDYYYVSRLPGEPLEGVADRHFHPVEPLAFRLTLAKAF